MKKIKFNCRNIVGGYDSQLKLQTELKETIGYYFRWSDWHFVIHKSFSTSGYYGGWRVTELSTGCGITGLSLTRKEALQQFEEMKLKSFKKYGKFATNSFQMELKRRVNNMFEDYGIANDVSQFCGD